MEQTVLHFLRPLLVVGEAEMVSHLLVKVVVLAVLVAVVATHLRVAAQVLRVKEMMAAQVR
jgi:hypothetical protein